MENIPAAAVSRQGNGNSIMDKYIFPQQNIISGGY